MQQANSIYMLRVCLNGAIDCHVKTSMTDKVPAEIKYYYGVALKVLINLVAIY